VARVISERSVCLGALRWYWLAKLRRPNQTASNIARLERPVIATTDHQMSLVAISPIVRKTLSSSDDLGVTPVNQLSLL
jgi:hypothetical protein